MLARRHGAADDLQDATKLLKAGPAPAGAGAREQGARARSRRTPQARFLKGLILTEQGKTKEAIEIFTELTQDYPELPEPYNNLAVIYASQGQYDKARTALELSIRTHPSYATAYENLGDVYAKLASQAYDKALQLDSSNTAAQEQALAGARAGRRAAAAATAAAAAGARAAPPKEPGRAPAKPSLPKPAVVAAEAARSRPPEKPRRAGRRQRPRC